MERPQQIPFWTSFDKDFRNNQILWKYDKSSSATSEKSFLRTLPQYLLAFKKQDILISVEKLNCWFVRRFCVWITDLSRFGTQRSLLHTTMIRIKATIPRTVLIRINLVIFHISESSWSAIYRTKQFLKIRNIQNWGIIVFSIL